VDVDTFQATFPDENLSGEEIVYLYMDALRMPVRMARHVVKVPIQAVLGVRKDGQKVLLALEVAGSESTASWAAVVKSLTGRNLVSPKLVILDGNAGLIRAVKEAWPEAQVQRCVKHKLENLLAKAPKHCHAELKRDYGAITHAASPEMAHRAYDAFLRKWRGICQAVAESLEEAGKDLLTFTRFSKSQWRAIRTTNAIERLNGEFRRRTKTQGSFRNERSALVLLWGLVAFGQVCLRKIDGWKEVAKAWHQAA
jgi:transposase-like protein